jgi:hypothetical protein
MNVYQIHLAMRMQHVTTHKDITSAHVILATVVMDLHAMVSYTQHEYSGANDLNKHLLIINNFMFLYHLDSNECLPDSPCHANATCNNTEGSYLCTCDSGYSGDGFTCNGKTLMCNINIRE